MKSKEVKLLNLIKLLPVIGPAVVNILTKPDTHNTALQGKQSDVLSDLNTDAIPEEHIVANPFKDKIETKKRIEDMSHKLTMLTYLFEADFDRASRTYLKKEDQEFLKKFRNLKKDKIKNKMSRLNDKLIQLVNF